MSGIGAISSAYPGAHGVNVDVVPALTNRDRLSCAFRPILAIPHVLLVGAPAAFALSFGWHAEDGPQATWSASLGVLGAVAAVIAMIAWFAIVFTGRFPGGLWDLAAYYMRWRVRAIAYAALLRDEYPPFGDGVYPATLTLEAPDGPRDRLTVAFRMILVLPHLVAMWLLGIAWAVTIVAAWLVIIFTGNYPPKLYQFGVGVLRWNTRVESYLLLLRDEYPSFSLA